MNISRFVLTSSAAAAAILAPGLALAQAVSPSAQVDAEAAYRAQAAGRHAEAAVLAGRALQVSPDNLEWRLLLADSLTHSGNSAGALEALQPVSALLDYRVQSRRAEAARATNDLGQAAQAYGVAAPLAPTAEQRAYLSRSQVQVMVLQDQLVEARAALHSAYEAGMLPGDAPLDFAYVAVAAGDDRLAVRGFSEADALQPLQGAQALDAAYAARRTGADRTAAEWLEQGARTLPTAERTPQRLHDIGREIQALEHRFGGTVSVLTGPSTLSSALAASPGDNTTQLGGEAWARLGGDNNGRPVQGFVRAYQTLDSDAGVTGADSTQGWIGVRWKPFSETNLVVEASRMIALGDAARDDTAIRAAWSADLGGDLNYEQNDWLSARIYVDAVRLIEDGQTFAVADAQIGWTWVASQSRRDLVTAGLGLRTDYDSGRAETLAVAVGPRLGFRRWVGGDEFRAPGRYVDVSVGYDFQVNDGPREDGLVAALTFGF